MSYAQVIPFRPHADTPIGSTHMFVRSSSADMEIVYVFGELDLSVAAELELLLRTISAQPHLPAGVVDLTGCRYLDSSILNLFVRMFRQLNDRFAVVVPFANPARRILRIIGLDTVLPMYETVADAAADLGLLAPAI